MRAILVTLFVMTVCIFTSALYAMPPVVTENTTVKSNITRDMCPSSYEGRAGDGIVENTTQYGQNNSVATPGVRSCTGCTYDPNAKTCTCAKCYDYFDE